MAKKRHKREVKNENNEDKRKFFHKKNQNKFYFDCR